MKKNLIAALPVKYSLLTALSILLTLLSCAKSGGDDEVIVEPGTTNDIVSYIVLNTPGTIKEEGKGNNVKGNTIDVLVPVGNDLTNLTPTIAINGQSIDPTADEPQDFSEGKSVNYTVTAENGDTKTYTVRVETTETVREITRFVLAGVEGTIDRTNQNRRIELNVPNGTNLEIAPDILEFDGEGITPEQNDVQDFSKIVTYTVTAVDGNTRGYQVIVTPEGPSAANEIESFSFTINDETFAGDIDQDNNTIEVNVPNGTTVRNLAPTIVVSEGASVDPPSGEEQNFTNLVDYTVTAENGDSRVYTVTVNILPPPVLDDAFILSFKNTNTVTIPINTNFQYNYQVDKDGDGVFEEQGITNTRTFTFTTQGPHTIGIRGIFPAIQFGSAVGAAMAEKVDSIKQWGKIPWRSMQNAFKGCTEMKVSAIDTPELEGVTDMSGMFEGATLANPNVANWAVSSVTNMSAMFKNATSANPDVSEWQVSRVENMAGMFEGATSATLSGENNITNWNVQNVMTMARMFAGATNANPDVSQWDVSRVADMSGMFEGATLANPNVANWAVDNVTNMSAMFKNATSATVANLNNWSGKLTRVTDMSGMFEGATKANPDVIRWNVGSVQNMSAMFKQSAFNRRLEWRSLHNNVKMDNMFDNSALSTRYYTIALYVFGSKEVRNVTLGSAGMQISNYRDDGYGDYAKSRMGNLGWNIGSPTDNGSSSISKEVRDDIIALDKKEVIDIEKF